MRQYEITEENDNEGETFGYILELTNEQYEVIKTRFEDDEYVEYCTIEPSEYTQEQTDLINKKSRNRYMDRLGWYELEKDLDLEACEYWEFPYKGNGMIKINR